jgi:hypothetical protein
VSGVELLSEIDQCGGREQDVDDIAKRADEIATPATTST